MIDFLRGKAVRVEADHIVVDVHGVGYRVFCSNPYAYQGKLDEEVTVFIHYHVREDAILLYGFPSRDEQNLFRRLLDVSGIGPRVALGILSGGRPEAVVAAIQQENIAFLTKLPGIGKKTAQRIVLDLKDKLSAIAVGHMEAAGAGSAAYFGMRDEGLASAGHWAEAREALLALGYTETEVDRVWPAIKPKVNDGDAVDAIVKKALQALFQG
jgi:Holliday junction DNA helicase RuvA